MRTRLISLLFLVSMMLMAYRAVEAQKKPRPEMRAFWADGFNDGYKTPQQVDLLLQRLHDTHCNALFAQMRKGGDAYYLSRYEPWAADDTAHFDALAYLIAQAHAMKPPIAVHAWINTCAVGKGMSHPTNHIAQIHPEYLSVDPENDPNDHEAYKIDPGNPEAADWTFRLYLDVARHYDVDGVHFDFVRYGAKNWGYNPVSVARFQQAMALQSKKYRRIAGTQQPDPADPNWKQWRRDQVTALVRKVYAQIAQVDPKIVVSAATICWSHGPRSMKDWNAKSAAMNRVYQDWRGWLQEGILDLACPMTYFSAAKAGYQHEWSEWIKEHQYKRVATVGVGVWLNTIGQSFALMRIARAPSKQGHFPYGVLLYSYQGTDVSETSDAQGKRTEESFSPAFYAALSRPSSYAAQPPFPMDALLPSMPWKTQPKSGHLKGFVLTPKLDAVDGATITVRGRGKSFKGLTDGTGFYALIDLPPGDYTVRLTAHGLTPQTAKAHIEAGKVNTVDFTCGNPDIPLTTSLADLQGGSAPLPGTPVRAENLLVLLGSDTFPGNLYVRDVQGTGLRVHLMTPPTLAFQPGDVISLAGTLAHLEGEPAIDHATVRLTDIQPMRVLPAPMTLASTNPSGLMPPRGTIATILGTVTDIRDGGFHVRLEEGGEALVTLAGRKDPGIEASAFGVAPPLPGARVQVTGLTSVALVGVEALPVVRLYPRLAEDVRILPSVSAQYNPLALEVALATFRRPTPLDTPGP